MTADELKRLFEPWREKHLRSAWKPIPGSEDTLSWFGGRPTGSADDVWPECARCKAPMNFLVQLDLSSLPEQAKVPSREGLLQLYYCSTDDGGCETWEPFSGTHFIRVASSGSSLLTPPQGINPMARVSVRGWRQFQDAPHPEDHESLGLSIKYDFKKNVADVVSTEPFIEAKHVDLELNPAETISNSEPGDKLGGWPYWIQGAEYPRCPDGGEQMHLLLQIDSNDNLDYMFGDVGCAHLTYCPSHANVFAFGWACS